jgi:hypothetical protein
MAPALTGRRRSPESTERHAATESKLGIAAVCLGDVAGAGSGVKTAEMPLF